MSKIRLWNRLGAAVVIVSLFMTACYNYHDETYLDELDITATYYDTAFNFQQNTTFAIRDSVGIISDYLTDAEIAAFYRAGGGNDQIKALVRSNMITLGYTEVPAAANCDIGVNLMVAAVENTATYGYGWWYSYYDYYYWYWGGWYPYYGYPWYPLTYTYQTGTLLMEFAEGSSIRAYRTWADDKSEYEIEHANPDEVPQIHFIWQSILNGVAGTDVSYNKDRAERGINEAFTQSPYLKKN